MKTIQCSCMALLISIGLFSGCTAETQTGTASFSPSSHTTAQPIAAADCPNLYKVSDTFYRGAQPGAEGFQQLEKLGIKTVIDLRSFHSDQKALEGTSLQYINIPMQPWAPKLKDVRTFLTEVTNPANQPVFVHCHHGSDRAGTMTAVYRMVVEGWTRQQAVDEMTEGPFGFHKIWSGLPKFLNNLDINTLRAEYQKQ